MSGGGGPVDEDAYRTVDRPGASFLEIQGSKFRGRTQSIDDVDSAETFIAAVREEFSDASHVVSAYRIRRDSGGAAGGYLLETHAGDDGEPAGSAGSPALTHLERRDLENVAMAVVRQHGGTNLGIGRLSRTYNHAVADAIDDAGIAVRHPHREVRLTIGYGDSGTVRSTVESADLSFDATYRADVTFLVEVPLSETEAVLDRIRSATQDRVDIEM